MQSSDRFAQHNHQWITVVNPTNRRMLLQACDNCGVVKSQNSILNRCAKPNDQNLISKAMAETFLLAG